MANDEQDASQNDAEEKVLQIRKIYIKDASFESPNTPAIFTAAWDPVLDIDIGHKVNTLSDDTYDVVLTVTAHVAVEDTTAFLVEVQQGGIFVIKGFPEDKVQQRLNVYCSMTLYPYVCSFIDGLVVKGGFPPIHLGPINFSKRYRDMLEEGEGQDYDEETGQ